MVGWQQVEQARSPDGGGRLETDDGDRDGDGCDERQSSRLPIRSTLEFPGPRTPVCVPQWIHVGPQWRDPSLSPRSFIETHERFILSTCVDWQTESICSPRQLHQTPEWNYGRKAPHATHRHARTHACRSGGNISDRCSLTRSSSSWKAACMKTHAGCATGWRKRQSSAPWNESFPKTGSLRQHNGQGRIFEPVLEGQIKLRGWPR